MTLKSFQQILRAPDEGGGGGGNAGADAGAGGNAGSGAGGNAGADAGAGGNAWKLPDGHGLPDHIVGKSADETLSKLLPFHKQLREEISNRGAVPKEAKYELNFSDRAKPFIDSEGQEKVLPILSKAMHKHGITDKQSAFVSDLIEGFVDSGIIAPPKDPNTMFAELVGADFRGSSEDKVKEGQRLNREAIALVENLKAQGTWSQDALAELRTLTASKGGIEALRQLSKAGMQDGPKPGGDPGGGAITKETLKTRRADPRNQYGNPKYDRAFAEETDRQYKDLFDEKN
jgi:hypothetical protein